MSSLTFKDVGLFFPAKATHHPAVGLEGILWLLPQPFPAPGRGLEFSTQDQNFVDRPNKGRDAMVLIRYPCSYLKR